jgi:hypothetical protein
VEALDPVDCRADAHPKLGRRPMPRQAAFDDSPHHPLTKVVEYGRPILLASFPASMLNQMSSDLGIWRVL